MEIKTRIKAGEAVLLSQLGEDAQDTGFEALRHLIVSWNLDEDFDNVQEDGSTVSKTRPVPVSVEAIRNLWADDLVTITNAVNKPHERTPEDQLGFTEGSTPGSKTAASPQAEASIDSSPSSSSTDTSD